MSTLKDHKYWISTDQGVVPVVGRRYGLRKALAVRVVELAEPKFVVDHIPTGRLIVEFADRCVAVRFARELDGLLGQILKGSDPQRLLDAMPETVRDWVKRVEVAGYVPFEAPPVVNGQRGEE